MNFNLYIIGNPNGIYKQMPDDYIASEISGFQKGLKGSRLVIMRKMNLMHYIYMEKIDASKFIGFCLVFNKAYIARPKQLIALFKYLIEDYLLNKGDIIRYSQKGELQYVIDSFSQNTERYRQINFLIKERFETQTALYGISELTAIFNGEHTSRNVSIGLEENQLLQMSFSYNTLIIDDSVGINQGYIPKIISNLREQVDNLTSKIGLLTQENEKLKRQKKQFKLVLILLSLIIIGIIVFAIYAQDKTQTIQQMTDKIYELNNTVDIKNAYIIDLKQDSTNLSKENEQWINKYNTLSEKYDNIKTYSDKIPLIISNIKIGNTDYNRNILTDFGNRIYSSTTRYFTPKIYYTSTKDATITLKTKWYDRDGTLSRNNEKSPINFSQSDEYSISSGFNNELRMRGWGRDTNGNWKAGKYIVEIWYEDICLGVKHFEVY